MKEIILEGVELKYRYVINKSGIVTNLDTNRTIKPYNDPRRPGECPAIYLKKADGKTRVFLYHDQLMAICYFPEYDGKGAVHHLDGNIYNCELSNLSIERGLDILKSKYHETAEWVKVELDDVNLYYDYYICEDGRLYNSSTDAFVKPFKDNRERNKDFLRYNLYIGKNVTDVIHFAASRLVALHFIPKPECKDIVMFVDGDTQNIHKDNLSWGDRWDVSNKNHLLEREFTILDEPGIGKEKWKKLHIPGVELVDNYLISSYGRVWNDTKKFYSHIRRDSSPNLNNQSHMSVSINTTDGYLSFRLHRLVAFTFVKNEYPSIRTLVNHINGNPEYNYAFNLEWCTPSENVRHAVRTNLLHSNHYSSMVNDKNWRLNTIIAWIYAFKDMTDERAYKIYQGYIQKYNDNIPELSFKEFIDIYENKLQNDKDFIKINNFYKSEYQIQL